MKPKNKPEFCKICGGKIIECASENNKKTRVFICCICSEEHGTTTDSYKMSMFRKHKHLASNRRLKELWGE